MMLKTGNKRGLSLIELMVAVMVLGVGTLMIQEGLLRSSGLFGLYTHSFQVGLWIENEFWKTKEALFYSDDNPQTGVLSGTFESRGRVFNWNRDISLIPGSDMYSILYTVDWNEGNRIVETKKEAYVFWREKIK